MNQTIIRRTINTDDLQFSAEIPLLLQKLYGGRHLCSDDDLKRDLGSLIPPEQLAGLDQAVSLLVAALQGQDRVLVVGDFDADGATSSALAILAMRAFGFKQVDYVVPNRFEYGYGLTPEIVQVALEREPDLIVTVDNGISSLAGVQVAQEAGVKVLVTDHHLAGSELPEADAIVNPNQPGCSFPSKNLAGVGVVFYLMSALRGRLRALNWFSEQHLPEPNMGSFLDLVALGTVADVVPLDRNNRILVHQGIQRIRVGKARPGIQALLQVAGRSLNSLSRMDLGFVLGPRLNAAGRLDDMSLGIECLLAEDPFRAKEMAVELDALNRERREIEAEMKNQALDNLQQLEETWLDEPPVGLCLFNKDWHQGVIGILASRIKDFYHRPVIAFALAGDGTIKGSARSIPGFHIRDALDAIAARYPGVLSKFGGHAMAAGLSLELDKLEEFSKAFDAYAQEVLEPEQLNKNIVTDGELNANELTLATAKLVHNSGPWGQGFPEPLFDGEFRLLKQRLVGEKHLKIEVQSVGSQGLRVSGIVFNVDLESWPNKEVDRISLVYHLGVNDYQGQESLQLVVEYLELVN